MTPREQKMLSMLKKLAFDAKLVGESDGYCYFDYYELEVESIQAARDLIRDIEQEEANGKA